MLTIKKVYVGVGLVGGILLLLFPLFFLQADNHVYYGTFTDEDGNEVAVANYDGSAKPTDDGTYKGLVKNVRGLLNLLVPLLISFGILFFLWNVLGYIRSGGDEKKHTDARNGMIWGIVALFIMVSLWGFINLGLTFFSALIGGNITDAPKGSIIVEP